MTDTDFDSARQLAEDEYRSSETLPGGTNTAVAGMDNPYLAAHIGALMLRSALPIIAVMLMQGIFTIVDAVFIGVYVGAEALTAVTLMFPMFMIMVALSTLTGAGMSSVLARQLGAKDKDGATDTLMAAMLLAACVGLLLAAGFALFGHDITLAAASGNAAIAAMSWDYMAPLTFTAISPMIATVNSDAMRSEGHIRIMAGMMVLASLSNLALNWLFIAHLDMGVFGSALGTIVSQAVALAIILYLRASGQLTLRLRAHLPDDMPALWGNILSLGLPPALNFVGISLMSAGVITSLQIYGGDGYVTTIAAYGIITRVTSLTFLPLLGLSQATQAIVGNNAGAGLWTRSDRAVTLAMRTAVIYAILVQIAFMPFGGFWSSLFVSDPAVHAEAQRLLPILIFGFSFFAPMMILTGYFQALGDKLRAAFLGLGPIYLVRLPLLGIFPVFLDELGIWAATPVGDVIMFSLLGVMLAVTARRTGHRWGFLRG